MKNHYRVAASITAYEDEDAVKTCLQSIQQQSFKVETVLIVDNSHEPILSSKYVEKGIVVRACPENIGTAGALKLQVEWAIEQGFDFIWIFDQDSKPQKDCLEKLIDCYEMLASSNFPIGIIAPIPIEPETGYKLHGLNFEGYRLSPVKPECNKKSFYTCDVVIASGSLVNTDAAQTIEVPNTDLFIDAVDWAYCLALRQREFNVVVVNNAFMDHNYASCSTGRLPFLRKDVLIHNYSPMRRYYICRNHTYILKQYAEKYLSLHLYTSRISYLAKTVFKILAYEHSDKRTKVWACISGTIDGFRGDLKRRWV